LIVKVLAWLAAVLVIATWTGSPLAASAQAPAGDGPPQTTPERPTIRPDRRSEEDRSVLADPRVAREPLHELKYIPLVPTDPNTYLSVGM